MGLTLKESQYAKDIKSITDLGIEVAVVIEEEIFFVAFQQPVMESIEFRGIIWAC